MRAVCSRVGISGLPGTRSPDVAFPPHVRCPARRKVVRMGRLWESAQVHLGLILLQTLFAGYQVISRVAINDGLSVIIFSLYRNAIALALLVPVAIIFERHVFSSLESVVSVAFGVFLSVSYGSDLCRQCCAAERRDLLLLGRC